MIELTDEQHLALVNAEPSMLRDPRTDKMYVLVPVELYERMCAIIDGAAKRAGWDDPVLDAYEQYRKTT